MYYGKNVAVLINKKTLSHCNTEAYPYKLFINSPLHPALFPMLQIRL